MSLTIRDAEDAALAGWIDFITTWQEFINDWYMPIVEAAQARQLEQLVTMWDNIPATLHKALSEASPEMHSQLTKLVNEAKERGTYYAR